MPDQKYIYDSIILPNKVQIKNENPLIASNNSHIKNENSMKAPNNSQIIPLI